MSSIQFSRWFAVVLLVGCNAKLQVDPTGNGGAGVAGAGGAGAVTAGQGPIDRGGDSAGGGGNVGGDQPIGGSGCGVGDFGCAGFPNFAGAGGAAPPEPGPGQHGQPCIPKSSSVEADGSPAKATIATLDRCDNGLVCDATKHCTAMPACPQATGPCVVHGVPLEDPGTGGTGGAGGGFNGGGGAPTA